MAVGVWIEFFIEADNFVLQSVTFH